MVRTFFLVISTLLMLTNQSIVCAPTKCVTGKGKIVSEIRKIKDFTGIEVMGSMDVEIYSGKEYSVEVKDYENLLPLLVTEKQGNVLKITFDGCVRNSRAVVKITMPKLEKISSLGSGDITINGEFESEGPVVVSSLGSGDITFNALLTGGKDLEIIQKGSGDVRFNSVMPEADVIYKSLGSGDGTLNLPGNIGRLVVKLAGSGDLTIKGDSAREAQFTLLGSGDCDAKNIVLGDVYVQILGSGDCYINVNGGLKAKLMGSGDVLYRGMPKNMEVNKMGSGSVIKQ